MRCNAVALCTAVGGAMAVMLCSVASLAVGPNSSGKIFEGTKEAIFKISVSGVSRDGKRVEGRTGTGFVVYSDERRNLTYVVTAAHVVGAHHEWLESEDGTSRRRIRLTRTEESGAIVEVAKNARVVGSNSRKMVDDDWELLVFSGAGYQGLRLGSDPRPGEEVLLVGIPGHANWVQFLKGEVGAYDIDLYKYRIPVMFSSNPDRGQSGSPVLNLGGEVVGMASRNFSEGNVRPHLAIFVSQFSERVASLFVNTGSTAVSKREAAEGSIDENIALMYFEVISEMTEWIEEGPVIRTTRSNMVKYLRMLDGVIGGAEGELKERIIFEKRIGQFTGGVMVWFCAEFKEVILSKSRACVRCDTSTTIFNNAKLQCDHAKWGADVLQ